MKNVTGGNLDLGDCENVHQWAQEIYNKVESGEMPPGGKWSDQYIANFKAWMDAGAVCPAQQPAPDAEAAC